MSVLLTYRDPRLNGAAEFTVLASDSTTGNPVHEGRFDLLDANARDVFARQTADVLGTESVLPVIAEQLGTKLAEVETEQRRSAKRPTAQPDYDPRAVAHLATDIGNAARFSIRNRDTLRFCKKWNTWLVWDGTRWRSDERNYFVRLAKQTALSIFDEAKSADGDQQQRLSRWSVTSQKRERLTAMVELAKSELAVTPDELDSNPWSLNVRNGTVDLRTGKLREHRREDYCTKICRANYDPDAKTPLFQAFLARIFRTHPGLIGYVRKAFGYCLTGLVNEQSLFFCYGLGSNGKSKLLDAVMFTMGDYAGKADRDLLISNKGSTHPTNMADLQGLRLAVCSETDDGKRFDEAKLKDLVGETRIKARRMKCDFFEFTATHKLFLYSNHLPIVRGQDHGFWRRMRVIPFIETIGEAEKDTELGDKLQAEVDGILAWAIGGLLLWQREGLGVPQEVADATEAYRSEMDSIGLFFEECCQFGPKLMAMAGDLYVAYTKHCVEHGENPLSQKMLGMALRARGMTDGKESYTGRKLWRGIGLRVTPEAAESARSFGA